MQFSFWMKFDRNELQVLSRMKSRNLYSLVLGQKKKSLLPLLPLEDRNTKPSGRIVNAEHCAQLLQDTTLLDSSTDQSSVRQVLIQSTGTGAILLGQLFDAICHLLFSEIETFLKGSELVPVVL